MKSTQRIQINIVLLLLVCLQGCDGHAKDGDLVFKEVRQGQVELCSSPFFYDTIKDLYVLNDCFVVVGFSRANERFIHVFDKNTGKYKDSFVDRGRSGDELLSVTDTYLSENDLNIWDAEQKMLSLCNITDVAKTVYLPLSKHEAPVKAFYPYILTNGERAVLIGNASFIENAPINDKPRLLFVDMVSGKQESYNDYPLTDRFKTWWMYMQPVLAADSNMKRLAILSNCYYGCIMELFDLSAISIRCTHTRVLVPPSFEGTANGVTPGEDLRYGAINAVCTDEYVIVAYDGETRVAEKGADPFFNKILWFDWTGPPVRKLVIDKSVKYLCIDKQDLYALAGNDEGDVIVRII